MMFTKLALLASMALAGTIRYDFVDDRMAESTIVRPNSRHLFARSSETDQSTEAGFTGTCSSCRENQNILDLQAVVSGDLKIGDLTTWKRKGGLVEVPVSGANGPCGSAYTSGEKAWASPIAACVLLSALHDWKKRCPSDKDCQISFSPASDNRDGHCFNFGAMKERTVTLEMLSTLYDKGAAKVDFTEGAKSLRACFKPSKKADDTCRAFKYDASLCGAE